VSHERNLNLDLLRLLGILVIILAHSSPPDWLFQLRNFGTPILIVVSALSYSYIYSQRQLDILPFYKKRLIRLTLPAWIFLSLFFCFFLFASITLGKKYPFTVNEIISSYSFYTGIGFVWIFKVYIILALITPVALTFNRRINSNRFYFSLLVVAYILYEIVLNYSHQLIPDDFLEFFDTVAFVIFPYSILYLYGFRLSSISDKQLLRIIFTSLAIFVCLMAYKYSEYGAFIPTQKYKYPPTIYYLSYAFFALNLVYFYIKKLKITNAHASNIIVWLSKNTLWIYLWHIMAYYIWQFLSYNLNENFLLFLIKTAYLLGFGIAVTWIQRKLVVKFVPQDHILGKKVSALLT